MNISHVAVYTYDLDKSIEFYKLFGGEEIHRVTIPLPNGGTKTLVHVAFGDAAVELVCPSDESMIKTCEGAVGHFCLCCDDIEAAFEMLKEKGVTSFIDDKPTVVGAMGIHKKLFLNGPTGEIIELIEKI